MDPILLTGHSQGAGLGETFGTNFQTNNDSKHTRAAVVATVLRAHQHAANANAPRVACIALAPPKVLDQTGFLEAQYATFSN